MKITHIFPVALLCLLSYNAFSQAGLPDLTFGLNGKRTVTVDPADEYARSTKVDANGSIFSTGIYNPTITTGSSSCFFVTKHAANGAPDNTFANNGIFKDTLTGGAYLSDLEITSAGGIIAVGGTPGAPFHPFLIKLTPAGTYDATFGLNGKANLPAFQNVALSDVKLLPNGKILASAAYYNGSNDYDLALMRFNANGAADVTFGTNGLLILNNLPTYELIEGMAVQPDGKIILVGRVYTVFDQSQGLVMRLDSNGQPDNTFGTNGKAVITATSGAGYCALLDVTLQSDGKIVSTGFTIQQVPGPTAYINNFLVSRLLSNGAPDPGFAANGILISDIFVGNEHAVASVIQPDGKIVAFGGAGDAYPSMQSYYSVARYLANGNLDMTFNTTGIIIDNVSGTESQSPVDICICPDGGILVTGCAWDQDTTFSFNTVYAKYRSGLVTTTITAINEQEDYFSGLSVYPNPANDRLNISLKDDSMPFKGTLTDAAGKTVAEFDTAAPLDTRLLADGFYFLTISNEQKDFHEKIIIRHY